MSSHGYTCSVKPAASTSSYDLMGTGLPVSSSVCADVPFMEMVIVVQIVVWE